LTPMMAVHLAKEDEAGFIARGQQIAREEGIYLAMAYAVEYQDGSPFEQKLLILDPAGQVALEHYKYGGQALEGFKPGDGVLRTVQTPFGTLSGIICNDTNHEEIVTQAGRNSTDIILSPSLEFREMAIPSRFDKEAELAVYCRCRRKLTMPNILVW